MISPENFAYWLNGFVEVTEGKRPSDKQWRTITDHLAEVFVKTTPNRFTPILSPNFIPDVDAYHPILTGAPSTPVTRFPPYRLSDPSGELNIYATTITC